MYRNANEATLQHLAEIKRLLAEINTAADKTTKDFTVDGGTNWAYAGSLAHVAAQLAEIRSFLSGEG